MAAQRPLVPQIVTDDPEPKSARRSFGTASTSQQDKIALEDARLRSIWEDAMKEVGGPSQPHRKALVLMISWAPELDELQTSDEVENLGKVLAEKFNYIVVRGRIEKNDKLPQHQVSKYLADFVYDHDGDGSLLIIYYAGHGIRGAPGELTLAGQVDWPVIRSYCSNMWAIRNNKPNDQITERNAILWHEAESIVKKTRADVLIIFDCCFAGNLISHGRSIYPRRNFEFLAATGHSTTTPVPGPHSFTSALVWALEKLVASKVPFSTMELFNQIGNEAPNFPRKQIPILKQRYELTDRRLMLPPIPKDGEFAPAETKPSVEKHKEAVKESLDLRFFFDKRPSDEDIQQLSKELKELIDKGAISTSRIGWVGLRSKDIVKAAAMKWMNYRKPSVSSPAPTRLSLSPQDIG
jgi:hypothetical protein